MRVLIARVLGEVWYKIRPARTENSDTGSETRDLACHRDMHDLPTRTNLLVTNGPLTAHAWADCMGARGGISGSDSKLDQAGLRPLIQVLKPGIWHARELYMTSPRGQTCWFHMDPSLPMHGLIAWVLGAGSPDLIQK